MKTRVTRGLYVRALICMALLGAALQAPPARAQFPPETLENLQVLSKDMDVRALIGVMRGFSMGLGVRCQHCHVGVEGAPLTEVDFVSDEKPEKRAARLMMRMTEAINGTHLTELDVEEAARRTVRCVTCHRGMPRPTTLAHELLDELDGAGVEAAVGRYRELREEHYGSDIFDFSEWSLVGFAESIVREEGRSEAVETLLKLNLEHFPDSVATWNFLAEFYRRLDRIDEAKAAIAKVLAVDPEDGRAQQIRERIEGGGD